MLNSPVEDKWDKRPSLPMVNEAKAAMFKHFGGGFS